MVGAQHIEVRIAASERDMQGAFAVRREVFIVEQGVPEELERDEADDSAVHVVASAGSAAIGTARLTQDGEARIGRVAVLPAWRRRGIAGLLLAALEAEAQRLGMAETSLHAQTYVQALRATRLCGHGSWIRGGGHRPRADVEAARLGIL